MHPEIKEITAKMKVLKFGGTSVGSPENMRAVMDLVTDGEQKIVVLSAMSGTTNALVEISNYLHKKNKDTARIFIGKLEDKYKKVVSELYFSDKNKRQGARVIKDCFDTIKSFTSGTFNEVGENTILAQGEIISTNLVALLMNEKGFQTKLLPALDFMKIDEDKAADLPYIRKNIKLVLEDVGEADYYITQGFICKDANGNVNNLQRGGSDYTASLIGAAIEVHRLLGPGLLEPVYEEALCHEMHSRGIKFVRQQSVPIPCNGFLRTYLNKIVRQS